MTSRITWPGCPLAGCLAPTPQAPGAPMTLSRAMFLCLDMDTFFCDVKTTRVARSWGRGFCATK